MEDVNDSLTKYVTSLEKKQKGEYGMKQCPNCGDIALEEYDKGHWICGYMWLGSL